MNNIYVCLLLSFLLIGCGSNIHANKVEHSIGTAKMLDDGSIALSLVAEEVGGDAIGDGYFVYKLNDPYYGFIKKHLGGIEKGEIKNVPPFPSEKGGSK